MIPPSTDKSTGQPRSNVTTDGAPPSYDDQEFLSAPDDEPQEWCEDDDYASVWRQRWPGGLTRSVAAQLRVACMKIARAYGQRLSAEGVAVAPWSACARLGRLNVALSPRGAGWQARVSSGLLGWDRVHLWAEDATPGGALAKLVECAQAAAKRKAARK